jgi:hypothetical protein
MLGGASLHSIEVVTFLKNPLYETYTPAGKILEAAEIVMVPSQAALLLFAIRRRFKRRSAPDNQHLQPVLGQKQAVMLGSVLHVNDAFERRLGIENLNCRHRVANCRLIAVRLPRVWQSPWWRSGGVGERRGG